MFFVCCFKKFNFDVVILTLMAMPGARILSALRKTILRIFQLILLKCRDKLRRIKMGTIKSMEGFGGFFLALFKESKNVNHI